MQAHEMMTTSLYLSRLSLNLRSRHVRDDLANSQALHRRMLDAFPHASREANGLLYRIDPAGSSLLHGATVLAQSVAEPDWGTLPEGYLATSGEFGFDLDGDAQVKDIAATYGGIRAGDLFRFRLRASPTKRIAWEAFRRAYPERAAHQEARRPDRSPRKLNGPRVPITDYTIDKILWERDHPGETYRHPESAESMLHAWMVRKGCEHGFLVADLGIRPDPLTGDMQYGQKSGDDGTKLALAHKAVVFDGVLKVADLDAFQRALRQGIGSGKAYGFGLLSIRRG